jgi:hypothetical protein
MQIEIKAPLADNANEWSTYLKEIHESPANRLRKERSWIVKDYYEDAGKQQVYLEAEMRRLFTDIKYKRKWTQPVTKLVVDALAVTYSGIVKRDTQEVDEETKKTLHSVFFKNLDSVMSTANKMLVGQRNSFNSALLF